MAEVTREVVDSNASNWSDAVTQDLFLQISGKVTQTVLEVLANVDSRALVTQVVLEVLVALAVPKNVSDDLASWLDAVNTEFGSVWTEPVVSDDLNLWTSETTLILHTDLQVGDSNEANWNDTVEVALRAALALTPSDNSAAYYDDIEVVLAIYFAPVTREIFDAINTFSDAVDAVSYLFEGEEIAYELGDILHLTESVALSMHLGLELADDLNSWNDGVITMPGDYVELSYDEMTSNWADAVAVDFKQHRGISDSFSLSDAVSTSLAAFLQEKTVADSLNNWLDGVTKRVINTKAVSDNFALYDSIKLRFTLAFAKSDTMSMSDVVEVSLSTKDQTIADSADLWQDLVQAELTARQSVSVADTLNNWSDAEANDKFGFDPSYIRRYLNDVKL